jgi:inner membrane protein
MMLRTHIAFGLLIGILAWYFFNLDPSFILVTGFAAFLPDIDLTINRELGDLEVTRELGVKVRHRTITHSLWFLLALTIATYSLTQNVTFAFASFIGCLSHLLSDSLTKTGVYWLWPIGKPSDDGSYEGKYHLKWEISTGNETIQRIIQSILFGASGFLFFSKSVQINLFSLEGMISLVFLIFIGYVFVQKMSNVVVNFIRKLRI